MTQTSATIPWRLFFVRILLPTILTITLFLAVIFFSILPTIEQNSLDRKREMIRELTNSVWNILAKLEYDEQNKIITREQAQKLAIDQIRNLHYGQQMKDYFWLNDMQPKMIIHPYRSDLNGQDLSQYADPNGKLVFVEMVNVVKKSGSGYVEYMWQWKDDENRIVPKISFVKGFAPWGWVIGTGIYIEDVKQEISKITNDVIFISIIILLIMTLLLATIVYHAYKTDMERTKVENELHKSREQYRNLVESATVGIFVANDKQILFSNQNLLMLLDYTEEQLHAMKLGELFDMQSDTDTTQAIKDLIQGQISSARIETRLKTQAGTWIDVLLSTTEYIIDGKPGFIAAVTDLSSPGQIRLSNDEMESFLTKEQEYQKLLSEMQTALSYHNSSLLELNLRDLKTCKAHNSVRTVVKQLREPKSKVVFVVDDDNKPMGLVSQDTINRQLLKPSFSLDANVSSIMNKTVHSLPQSTRVIDAGVYMKIKETSELLITDTMDKPVGVIIPDDLATIHKYSPVILLDEIKQSKRPEEIIEKNRIFTTIITIFINSGAKPQYINQLITENTDMVVSRFIEFAIQQLGPPPAKFSFMNFGSVGRHEQTLNSDQDNAIIYEDVEESQNKSVQEYFLIFGEKLCNWLDKAGYTYCPGDYMAQNPKWCQPLSEWKKYFSNWICYSDEADLLQTKIFFDFRSAYGEQCLISELREHLNSVIEKTPRFFQMLSRNILKLSPPLGLFGNFVVESIGDQEKAFDIKSAMMPIVDYARIYALKHKIDIPNTLERLKRLLEVGVIDFQKYQELEQAYSYLMQIRLRHQSDCISQRVAKINNYISPKKLTFIEQKILKEIFTQTKYFQTTLSYDFTGRLDGAQ